MAAYTLSLGPSPSYPVPLLSDFHPHGKVIKSYGLYNEKTGTSYRGVVLIDKGGTIRFKRTYQSIIRAGPTGQGIVESELNPLDILAEVEKIQDIYER